MPRNRDVAFTARLDNAKLMTSMLQCLSSSSEKNQHCQVEVSAQGLVFIVLGRSKNTQAQATLQAEIFQDFRCFDEVFRFTINFFTFFECLQILGPANSLVTSVTMSYLKSHALFTLALEEGGVVTTCDIRAIDDSDFDELSRLAVAFRGSTEVCRAILRSDLLLPLLSDLADVNGATAVKLAMSSNRHLPPLMFTTIGGNTACEIEFSRQSEAFVHLEGMRALVIAKETYIRVTASGMLCIQHQLEEGKGKGKGKGDEGKGKGKDKVKGRDGVDTYLDFLICPMVGVGLEDEEEEEEELRVRVRDRDRREREEEGERTREIGMVLEGEDEG